ncbi:MULTISPECIES: flagellar basal-body rod protein FlgF [unclassified Candidatus Frackibacter]|jgi:flagellar basal-body rod protein FlgG|uniref:flagellar basal-body rod protein FlgF n=1 Tax=unclassified Candidatus Frackibacter TaxID=2648818 RepID=UPI00079ADC63|nr:MULTISPECIES: flagellar basal-body rod protein FlgF [unclassified Candidatus Frackibacter]KXS45308.1 MAG: flagellar basal-body rod protein FlgG [Candidatus Frackibacter sp. T328-2]SDC10098.1 flagellar basal-body rod protein FlgG [Candidatus Frackibacter sp. WG11]SEM37367.1 flagellar basal-body rod protein FlgG [Candidatus Frackibacter sp. WG12]SFL42830.1 flagellar basal-body rod protein FlgG [Candidatus Frackibacter sp. WG13]
MLRGMYTAASGMNAALKRTNTITNNLANANTTGYKKDEAVNKSFSEMLLRRLPDGKVIGETGQGVKVDETSTDFSEGGLHKTDNPLDWAITGEGFFTVQTPQGIRYTRNGNFTLNQNGQVVTQNGNLVLGQAGPLEALGEDVQLDNSNNLVVDGQIIDQIRIVTFAQNDGLVKEGNSLYRATPDVGNQFIATGDIEQGYLESANVNVVESMTNMIEATRHYEANQRIVKTYDKSLEKTVNSVGRA